MSFLDNKINKSLKPAVSKIVIAKPRKPITGVKGRKNDGKPIETGTLGADGRKNDGKPIETGTLGADGRKNATKFNSEAEAYLAYLNGIKLSLIKAGRSQDEIDAIDAQIAAAAENIALEKSTEAPAPEENKILGMQKNTAYIVIGAAIILLIFVFVKLARARFAH